MEAQVHGTANKAELIALERFGEFRSSSHSRSVWGFPKQAALL